jgi:hypothetical protein
MRKIFPSSVKGGVGRRDALLGPTADCSIFAAAKIVDIVLTSSSTARFSPVDSQESQVSILRANIKAATCSVQRGTLYLSKMLGQAFPLGSYIEYSELAKVN